MKFSPVVKYSLILLLPLTLAWKLTVELKPKDLTEKSNIIVAFLTQHQFRDVVENDTPNGSTVITARSGSCRVLVVRTSPLGDSADQVQSFATDADHTFIVFRGIVYSKQPAFLTAMDYLWFTSLRRLGLVSQVPIVLAVVSSCNAQRLPWDMLNSI